MPQQDVLRIRDICTIGTELQLTTAEFPVPKKAFGWRRVIEHQVHGIMTVAVDDAANKSFIPVGCTVGHTDAEMTGETSFKVYFPQQDGTPRPGTAIFYALRPTTFWSMTYRDDGYWHIVEEGEAFRSMADRLFDLITRPGVKSPSDATIQRKAYILEHPELYPLAPGTPGATDSSRPASG